MDASVYRDVAAAVQVLMDRIQCKGDSILDSVDQIFQPSPSTGFCMLFPPLSEIQIGVMLWGRFTRDMIGKDCPKGWTRFQPCIPFASRLMIRPGHIVDVV